MQPKSLKDIDDQHLAIIGKVGSGKTYTAKGVVEVRLDALGHVVISDPTGAWWGITLDAKGKPGPSHRRICIIGGAHGHVPFPTEHAQIRTLAQLIMRDRISCILDTSEMLAGERMSTLTTFFEQLYASATLRPCHLVLDEADELARQNPVNEGKRLFHHVDRIVRRGRVKGFRVLMITQRPAVLHKDVLTQANALIAMRLTSPQDRGAMKAWIEGQADVVKGKSVIDSLPSLKPGTGWIWRPDDDLLVKQAMPRISSYDSSKTPEEGDVVAQQPAAASPAILALLRGVVAPAPVPAAKRPAMTEAQLKDLEDSTRILARIAELETENSTLAADLATVTAERNAAQQRVSDLEVWISETKDEILAAYERAAKAAADIYPVHGLIDALTSKLGELTKAQTPDLRPVPREIPRARTVVEPRRTFGAARPKAEGTTSGGSWSAMPGSERLECAFGLWRNSSRAVQEALAGLSPGGTTAGTYISRLRSKAAIGQNDAGGFQLTKDFSGPRPTKTEVFALWTKVGSKPMELLRALAKNADMTRDQLARSVNLPASGTTFGTYLSRARGTGLVVESNKVFSLIPELRKLAD